MIALLALSMAEAKGQCNFSSSSSTSPTTCSGSDGTITINGLGNNKDYTINYSKNGSAVTPFTVTTNGDGKLVIPSLGAGSYTNVTATKGCTTSAISYTLSDPAAPSLGSISFISPSGCNTSDGSFSISSMSANTAYTVNYKKAGIAQTPVNTTSDASGKVTVTGLSAAAYTNITISKNNCTSGSSGSVTITNPAPPSLGGLSAVAPTTCGGTDAAWYISSMTPATTYTVNYSKNGVAQTAVNLYASNSGILTMSNQGTGSYTNITVSLNGCTSTSTGNVTINNPTAPSVGGLSSTVPTSCNGNSATMLISNMTANSAYTVNYKYNGVAANPSLTTASASGVITVYSLAPGTYTNITVTKNNCVSSSAGPLTISNAATSSIGSTSSSNPVTCSGTEGTITINGLTANTIYYVNYNKNSVAQTAMYVTTNGSGVGVMTGLGSGSYSNVNVSTVTSCPSSNAGPFTLSDPSAPSIGSSTVTNTTTCSGNDGSIKLNGLTAITTYTVNYNKNGVAQFAQNLTTNASGSLMVSSLSAATYSSFTVTKSNCTSAGFGPIVVSDPAAPSIGSSSTVNPTTCSSTNGSITLGGLSANTAYTVNYSKNGIAQTAINLTTNSSGNLIISSLSSATYNNFTVTKSNCTSAAYGPIVLAGAPIFTMSSGNPTTCSGTDGSITLSGLSASTSYTINYNKNGVAQTALTTPSNASGVITISGLTATTYSNLTVTKTGCSSSPMSSVVLTEPSAPTPIASYVNPSTCNGTNGSITLNNLIPSSSYTINYSKAGITQTPVVATSNASGVVVISNLSAGTYSSISATKSYCVSNLAGTITLSDPIAPSITSSNSGTVCQGSSISLSASTVSGATYSWSGPNGYSNSSQNPTITNASATQAGTYSVTATANNCISTVATTTVAVNTNTNPSISSANSVCAGASTTVTFTGAANSVVTYSVNNGSNQTVTLNNSGSGSISTGTLNTANSYGTQRPTAG
ncbi:MAG: immunoglobulin domain-containing protein, partial [Bacteroidota bacterium]